MSWQNLTNEELTKLPTHRLYQIFKLVRSNVYQSSYDDGECDPIHEEERDAEEEKMLFIKSILDERDHIARTNTQADLANQTLSPNNDLTKVSQPKEGPIKPDEADSFIGAFVCKRSKKKFKSGEHFNTVKSVTTNPHTQRPAFSFEEDTSIVDISTCAPEGHWKTL